MTQTAAAAIIQNKKILLLKRSQNTKRYPRCWTFPGGKSEKNETPEETVIREVKEETGFDFKSIKLIYKPTSDNAGTHVFTGEINGTINIQKSEVQEYSWFTYKETSNIKFAFSFKEHIETLHKLKLI